MPSSWQSLAAPGSTVADYLSHLPASTLPLSLHHFLKYQESIKKENDGGSGSGGGDSSMSHGQEASPLLNAAGKKKKKKKPKVFI